MTGRRKNGGAANEDIGGSPKSAITFYDARRWQIQPFASMVIGGQYSSSHKGRVRCLTRVRR